jgi:hypothetical protein
MLNLNKTLILLLLVFSYTDATSTDTREFLSAYFGVIHGKEWKLNEDCLGGEFEKDLKELYNSMIKLNIHKIVKNIEKIIELESEKCPFEEGSVVLKDFKTAFRNGTMLKNSIKNHILIKNRIEEYLNSDRSMKRMGLCLGYVTKMIVYGTPSSSYEINKNIIFVDEFLKFLA